MTDTYYEEEESVEKDDLDDNSEGYQSMIEAQILNYILDTGTFDFIKDNALDKEYFPGYSEEISFIIEHHSKYKVIPDLTTFLEKFPDFDLFEVQEAPEAMLESIKEARGYALLAPALVEIDNIAKTNSIEAANAMKAKAEEILSEVSLLRFTKGYDIFKLASDRYAEYLRRIELHGELGCIWNIPRFDETVGGTREDDFVALQGRPGEGKSWILEYLLLQPWLIQGKKVLLFSLENNKSVVGYRADTLLKHFSNFGLMTGKEVLGWEGTAPSLVKEDYEAWIEEAKKFDVPFLVMDNADSVAGYYTIEDIESLIEINKPDIVGIDQLSLLAPSKNFRTIREHYIHCTRTIRQLVNKLKVPIYLNCQSGRDASKPNTKNKNAAPELHQIAESDSVGQDATKVVSLIQIEGILKLSLKKNTTGRSGVEALMRWDIDVGRLDPISIEDLEGNPERTF